VDRATIHKELREWFEWTKDNIKSMITQIIKSKELTTPLTKLSVKDKQTFQKDIDNIADKVIDKEIDYYINRYKISSKEEYANILERLSNEEILKIKRKCCNDVLDEINSKDGK
jgi:hypothetical protein